MSRRISYPAARPLAHLAPAEVSENWSLTTPTRRANLLLVTTFPGAEGRARKTEARSAAVCERSHSL
jgi:hypothetical protein